MIRVSIQPFEIHGDSGELAEFLLALSQPLTDQEMASMTDVSERTIRNWRCDPAFPVPRAVRPTRLQFLGYLMRNHAAIVPHFIDPTGK